MKFKYLLVVGLLFGGLDALLSSGLHSREVLKEVKLTYESKRKKDFEVILQQSEARYSPSVFYRPSSIKFKYNGKTIEVPKSIFNKMAIDNPVSTSFGSNEKDEISVFFNFYIDPKKSDCVMWFLIEKGAIKSCFISYVEGKKMIVEQAMAHGKVLKKRILNITEHH